MMTAYDRSTDDAARVSDDRPSAIDTASGMPLPVMLLLADLLTGICHSDGTLCEREHAALRPLLRRVLEVRELPRSVEARIVAFDAQSYDALGTARQFVAATGAGDRVLREVLEEMRTAEAGRLELDEDAYLLALELALLIARAEYQGQASKTPLRGMWTRVKRMEDIVLGCAALGALAVPMLAIAAGVRLTSPGPALFVQRRYGEGGEEFAMYKFRSMTTTENGATVKQATRGDVRVTPFGAFLRRTSLDELPQLVNVLLGDMSLVGPRPHATAHNEMYRRLIVRYMKRHSVKPGITGLAQVNGWRGETDTLEKMARRVEHDLRYIETWSLRLDLEIMFLTVFGNKVRENAY